MPGLHCHWNRSHTIELFLTIFPQDESAALWGSGMTVLVVFVGFGFSFGGGVVCLFVESDFSVALTNKNEFESQVVCLCHHLTYLVIYYMEKSCY